MKVTFEHVNSILKTLPIGYYTQNSEIEVILDDKCNQTYIDRVSRRIFISYPSISDMISSHSEMDLEFVIRCLLYHEVSHAILTPLTLKNSHPVNIFEDTRIELLLNDYYMGVNFQEFNKKWFDCYDKPATSYDDLFIQIVVFGKGPKKFITKRDKILVYSKNYTISTAERQSDYYKRDIECLYDEVKMYWLKDRFSSIINIFDIGDKSIEDEELEESDIEPNTYSVGDIKNLMSSTTNAYEDRQMSEMVAKLLSNIKSTKSRSFGASPSYSGKFNPRLVTREDYKFFTHATPAGSMAENNALHLNLFIDTSGSFSSNDYTVNCLIKALKDFEKKNRNFDFDVASMSVGEKILDRTRMEIHSHGGNHLTYKIFNIASQLQKSNAKNYNIVLFDGDAYSNCPKNESTLKSMSAFNMKNCTIISDYSNQNVITNQCPEAKKIFTYTYVEEFLKNIQICLQNFSRQN